MKTEWNANGQGELWTRKELAALEKTWLTLKPYLKADPMQMEFDFSPPARIDPSSVSPTGR